MSPCIPAEDNVMTFANSTSKSIWSWLNEMLHAFFGRACSLFYQDYKLAHFIGVQYTRHGSFLLSGV